MPVKDPATGQLCVAATISNPAGHVAEFCRQSSGAWLQFDLTGSWGGPAAVGDVEPLIDPQFDVSDLFFRDAGGDLWSLDRNANGSWTPDEITAGSAGTVLISDPAPVVDRQTDDPVVLAAVSPESPPQASFTPTVTTPVPTARRAVHARFVIAWHCDRRGTVIRSIRVQDVPRGGRVAVRCAGPVCPRLRASGVGSKRIARLLKSLIGRRLHPGDRLLITVTAPDRTREQIELRIRRQRLPLARLLGG